MFDVASYWEYRYAAGGDSGAGSKGFNYEFKRDYINHIIKRYDLRTIVDFGCGDGQQLREVLLEPSVERGPKPVLEEYYGIDVAPTAIKWCHELYTTWPMYHFDLLKDAQLGQYDLALSLDVLYHVISYEAYLAYLRRLFAPSRYVLLYANNTLRLSPTSPHMLFRDNLEEIKKLNLKTELVERQPNPTMRTCFALFRNIDR